MIRQAFTDWRDGRTRRLMNERLSRERQERNKELGVIEIPTDDGWIEIWWGPTINIKPKDEDNADAD